MAPVYRWFTASIALALTVPICACGNEAFDDPEEPLATQATALETALVARGSAWKFYDVGAAPSRGWTTAGFNDTAWKQGQAELGYGDGDEKTIVSYGPNASRKHVTTYFRRTFQLDSNTKVNSALLELLYDDGAVVYLNGKEVRRANMPAGTITYDTFASSVIAGRAETTWTSGVIPPEAFVVGTNVLAVEVHQSDRASSDLSFDLALSADTTSTTPTPETSFALRVDCGSSRATTDSEGRRWESDRGFSSGSIAVDRGSLPIEGTRDAFIYRSQRSKVASYSLAVPNGTYLVRLHFAETELEAASLRRFGVTVEGQRLPDFDPFVAAGGKARANVQDFRHVKVNDGKVDIVFDAIAGSSAIDGIEILPDVAAPAPTALKVYPGPSGIAPSTDYTATVNGKPLFVYGARASVETRYQAPPHQNAYETMGFSYFDFQGEVRVELTPTAKFSTVNVRPSWKGVTPRIENGKIVLVLKEPRNISIELDGSWHKPFFLFANPPETNVPTPGDPKVLRYGPGVHTIGYTVLGSGQTVYIEGGAIVRGTIVAENKSDVTIRGRGILDGSHREQGSTHQMRFVNVTGLNVEGIVMQDSPSWAMPMYDVTNATIDNVKMLHYRQNSDCLDVISGRNFLIQNSFLRCFDDGVTIKAYAVNGSGTTSVVPSNIRVRHNTIWTDWGYAALDIGAELRTTEVSNVRFEDNDVLHPSSAAISINNSEQALVTDVECNDTRVEDPRRRDLVRLWVGNDTYSRSSTRGNIRGVKIRGLRLLNGSDALPWVIQGYDANHRVENIAFSDTWLLGRHVTSAASVRSLQMNAFTSNITFAP